MNSQISRAIKAIETLKNGDLGTIIKILTSGVLGFVTISLLIMIVMNLVKLAHSSDRPGAREEIIKHLGVNFLSLAIIGGIDLFLAIFLFLF